MAILRKPKIGNFSQISNNVTQNENLSWKARGILCYLLSKPDGWEVRRADLLRASKKDKKDSLGGGLAELEKEGFICWIQARGADGKFESVCDVYEEALPADLRGQNVRGPLRFVTEGGFSASSEDGFSDDFEEENAENPPSDKSGETSETPAAIREKQKNENSTDAENPQRQTENENAENPPIAENPPTGKNDETSETPVNTGANAKTGKNENAENPQSPAAASSEDDAPLRENRNGKPATVNNKDLNNTEVINTEVFSNEKTNCDENEKIETWLSGLNPKQILELRKAICFLTYQKRGAVKAMTDAEWQAVAEIFNHWVCFWKLTKGTRLTAARGRAVLDRLRSVNGWSVEEIKNGIFGNSISLHHSGNNERGETYHDLELICRTDQHLAKAIGFYEANETKRNSKKDESNSNEKTHGNAAAGGRYAGTKQTASNGGGSDFGNDDEDAAALKRIGANPK